MRWTVFANSCSVHLRISSSFLRLSVVAPVNRSFCTLLVCLASSCSSADLYVVSTCDSIGMERLCSSLAALVALRTTLVDWLRGDEWRVGADAFCVLVFNFSSCPSRSEAMVVMVCTRVEVWWPMSVLALMMIPDMSQWKAVSNFSPTTSAQQSNNTNRITTE